MPITTSFSPFIFNASITNFPDETTISTFSQIITQSLLTTYISKDISTILSTNIFPNISTTLITNDPFLISTSTLSSIPTPFINFSYNETLTSSTIILYTKDNLLLNITNILKDKEVGKKYKIKGEDYEIIIKPSNSTMETNTTYINFKECEFILRTHYNISNSSFITLLQLELYNNYSNSLINQVEYELYDENFTKLNLNLCKDVDIEIIYAIKDNLFIDTEMINSLRNLGFDVFDNND